MHRVHASFVKSHLGILWVLFLTCCRDRSLLPLPPTTWSEMENIALGHLSPLKMHFCCFKQNNMMFDLILDLLFDSTTRRTVLKVVVSTFGVDVANDDVVVVVVVASVMMTLTYSRLT